MCPGDGSIGRSAAICLGLGGSEKTMQIVCAVEARQKIALGTH